MWRGLLFVLLIGCSQQTYDDYTGGKYLGAQYLRDPLGLGQFRHLHPMGHAGIGHPNICHPYNHHRFVVNSQ